jgi:hypothetical protein
MSFLMPSSPSPPPVPPPPANPSTMASTSVIQSGVSQKNTLATAEGAGFSGTNPTGAEGVKAPATTKTLLGG